MTAPAAYTFKRNPLTAGIYRRAWDRKHAALPQRFVFVATTGRSGTEFLQRVFSGVEGCVAIHEAWPIMNGPVMQAWNEGEEWGARRTYWVQKAVNIRRMTGDHDLYVETNHVFVKCFAQYAVEDFGDRLSIIHLRRDPVSVARSMLELGGIPGTEHGNDWYLDYRAPRNLVSMEDQLVDGAPYSDDFFRCLWYWYEIEARVLHLRRRTEHLQWLSLDWEGRMDPDSLECLIRALGKEPDPRRLEEVVGVKANEQTELKERRAPPREELDAMHHRFKEMLREKGYMPILET